MSSVILKPKGSLLDSKAFRRAVAVVLALALAGGIWLVAAKPFVVFPAGSASPVATGTLEVHGDTLCGNVHESAIPYTKDTPAVVVQPTDHVRRTNNGIAVDFMVCPTMSAVVSDLDVVVYADSTPSQPGGYAALRAFHQDIPWDGLRFTGILPTGDNLSTFDRMINPVKVTMYAERSGVKPPGSAPIDTTVVTLH